MKCESRVDPAAEQCLVEHNALGHIKSALRVTLDWRVPTVGVPRKISTVCFTLKSFQRHMERLMNLEEDGGYLVVVGESKPHWSSKVELLRCEHDQFRAELRDLLPEVQSMAADDEEQLGQVCDRIEGLLQHIDEHDQKETDLLQEALTQDDGGEG